MMYKVGRIRTICQCERREGAECQEKHRQSPFPTVKLVSLYVLFYPSSLFGAVRRVWEAAPYKKNRDFRICSVTLKKGGSFWRSVRPGDSHASDVGHWLRMTVLFGLSREESALAQNDRFKNPIKDGRAGWLSRLCFQINGCCTRFVRGRFRGCPGGF